MIPGSANPLLLATAAPTGYNIERSIRLNAPDGAFLSRTPASAGNRKTWTWSGWVKRSKLGTWQTIFSGYGAGNDTDYFSVQFSDADVINISAWSTGYLITTQVFRDASAWYHIVVALDTTQATASNRLKLYVNGNEVTTFSTDNRSSLTQNANRGINGAYEHNIGRRPFSAFYYCDLYIADIHFIDGQALTPSSFGEFDTSNVWQPKAYTGSYGTNGFQLKFADNSNNTATTLGKDTSGNGNNWTPNNLSVTAGAGNDSLVDSPSSPAGQTDSGAGGTVVGNYCTWNPLVKGQTGTPVYTNGNLDASATGNWAAVAGTLGIESGKYYWETTITAIGSSNQSCIGLLQAVPAFFLGLSSGSWGYLSDGRKFAAGSGSAYGSSFGLNDVIGVAFDRDNGTLVFYKNGVSQGTAYTGLTSGVYFPATSHVDSSTSATNFGQRPFAFPVSGFKSLNTANLPTPVIANGATAMDVKLYTGNGSTQTISGLNFSPDLVWVKCRVGIRNHVISDIIRGTNNVLASNTTSAQVSPAVNGQISAFNSDGFAVAAGTSDALETNHLNDTYAAWCWDAGTSTVTNTQGSITSQVRANASAGFSVVTFTYPASGSFTVGHGLNIAPSLIITKHRTRSESWYVYHSSVTSKDQYLVLNSTAATASFTNFWGTSAPSSTVFGGTVGASGISSDSDVAYCFAPVAGYSSMSSFVGNGSSDGVFVYTGFRPRWLLLKCSSVGDSFQHWHLFDTSRSASNISKERLQANSSAAEDSFSVIDLLSNGFKLRYTDSYFNQNGATYIYAAFAESPFAYARAR